MQSIATRIRLLLMLLAFSACGGSEDKPEVIDKLKPVVVELNPGPRPQPAVFGEEVTLDFHFISPDQTSSMTAESVEPVGGPSLLPPLVVESIESTDYPGIRHFRIRAKATVPALESTELVKFRYALIGSDGQRSVRVEGDFPAYPNAESEEANWTVANAEIISPEEGPVGSKVDLLATVDNPQNEGVKVGWFVSGGELKNRRDASSEWTLENGGEYTAILTVRGQKSRTAALRFRTVVYQ